MSPTHYTVFAHSVYTHNIAISVNVNIAAIGREKPLYPMVPHSRFLDEKSRYFVIYYRLERQRHTVKLHVNKRKQRNTQKPMDKQQWRDQNGSRCQSPHDCVDLLIVFVLSSCAYDYMHIESTIVNRAHSLYFSQVTNHLLLVKILTSDYVCSYYILVLN